MSTAIQSFAEFAVPDRVVLEEGLGGLPRVRLCHPSGAAAELYVHGAHVCSWSVPDAGEQLFVSRNAWFADGKPIRGGIPVVFPQFGDGPLPKHGLVRTQAWRVIHTAVSADGAPEIRLALQATADAWPFQVETVLRLELRARELCLEARVRNFGPKPVPFQYAFHTYFAVADIAATTVAGLAGVAFIDTLRNNVQETETRAAVTIDQEVDRVYVHAPDKLCLAARQSGRTLTIHKQNLPDAVVWNPWVAKSAALADFAPDEYQRMLCVETGAIARPVVLPPGAEWQAATRFELAAD